MAKNEIAEILEYASGNKQEKLIEMDTICQASDDNFLEILKRGFIISKNVRNLLSGGNSAYEEISDLIKAKFDNQVIAKLQ